MADKKIALVTGANKGIGKEIARQLGKMGTALLGSGLYCWTKNERYDIF